MTRIADYIKQIPEEIRDAIRGLDSEARQAIFICLLGNGEMSFSELKEKIGIGKANLNFHLKELTKAMLVRHYYRHLVGAEKFSFYSVTPFGQNLMESVVQSLSPSLVLTETTEEMERIDVTISRYKTTRKKVRVPVGVSGKKLQHAKIGVR